jgi:hypothetical protein
MPLRPTPERFLGMRIESPSLNSASEFELVIVRGQVMPPECLGLGESPVIRRKKTTFIAQLTLLIDALASGTPAISLRRRRPFERPPDITSTRIYQHCTHTATAPSQKLCSSSFHIATPPGTTEPRDPGGPPTPGTFPRSSQFPDDSRFLRQTIIDVLGWRKVLPADRRRCAALVAERLAGGSE